MLADCGWPRFAPSEIQAGPISSSRTAAMRTSASNSPVAEILVAYWKSDWRALLSVVAIVLLSSASSIAAPYLFSRLIDRLPKESVAIDLAWAFIIYAALVGLASALLRIVQFLSVITAENLGFITSTQFFDRILKKRAEIRRPAAGSHPGGRHRFCECLPRQLVPRGGRGPAGCGAAQ